MHSHPLKRNKKRQYRLSKRSIKDEYIDKQIWLLHRAMTNKIIKQPQLTQQVIAKLADFREQGRIGYSDYLHWLCLLENVNDSQAFNDGVLENSNKMKRLRRQTPFVGILTEQERQAALTAEAIGIIDHPDILFL
ncbi:hypothetical protein tinsulaeT_12450 [Thalassotalea insulae]|uniref:Uncharacterized protein n=1 Tax=Thalassotalea insulae TaxID=2056778 RepID=A0ABQ6GTX1_9GAMM|nr:hypothetical protein [Thalassotalea insulae]GLX77905.1 hypothetical protein tinsulaeT_12450 [Thalassotalea insulae]